MPGEQSNPKTSVKMEKQKTPKTRHNLYAHRSNQSVECSVYKITGSQPRKKWFKSKSRTESNGGPIA
jgi:hypothetical protein